MGHQLLRSGTSVAANARDASRARPLAEFKSKLGIVIQEADESMLWLELLVECCAVDDERLHRLHTEADELIAIFTTMLKRS